MKAKLRKQLEKQKQQWLSERPIWATVTVSPSTAAEMIERLRKWGHIEPEVAKRLLAAAEQTETAEVRFTRIRVSELTGVNADLQPKQVCSVGFERGLLQPSIWDVVALALSLDQTARADRTWLADELDAWLPGKQLVMDELGIGVSQTYRWLKNDYVAFKLP